MSLRIARTIPSRTRTPLVHRPALPVRPLSTFVSTSFSRPITRPALASSILLAGAGVGACVGTAAGRPASAQTARRYFWGKPLLAEEERGKQSEHGDKDKSSFLDKLPSLPDLPSPPTFSLPSLPSLPDFPTMSLPDVKSTLSSWSSSFTSLTSTFEKLQAELSLGPGSTYARIVEEGKDPAVHPELQFDASVRLGTDLALSERAYLRNRREAMRGAFARLMDVPLEEVDARDLPVVAIAASGGGYRAMLNTIGSLQEAKQSGIWDCVTFVSGVSGSCWALNVLYSVGAGQIDWTVKHLVERVKEPFLQPDTLISLLNTDDEASRHLLTAVILKEASKGGEISLVDVYGTLVSTRLYVPSDSLPPPQPLSVRALKTSSQRYFLENGQNPLPIYTTVRHDLPDQSAVAASASAAEGGEPDSAATVAREGSYTFFEVTPYETGSDKLGAWIPTWALGRLFDGGRSTERVPEIGLPVLSGIYASAFCATLFSYFKEVRPFLGRLPFYSTIDSFISSNADRLDAIHPLPPAELPNFLYNLGGELPPTIPASMTQLKTLGFADAGMELNLPYVPLMRRQTDIIIALDASADSQADWFLRAAEYSKQYEVEGSPSRWPAVDVEGLFPAPEALADAPDAAAKVDEAKRQEAVSAAPAGNGKKDGEREGVRTRNPEPVPLGSAPESRERAAGEDVRREEGRDGREKPMPESQPREPPLGRCSIWIGSTSANESSSCRNDHPTPADVQARDGIALAYIPLQGDAEFKDPLEVFSTWRFDYPEEESEKLIRLARSNFRAGEEQLKALLKGVWLRKRQQRLDDETKGR
ncbi:hypothetical protein JCM8097_000127 [Rhodosporidiobolus ruineniae]